jgi:P-type Cu+ transporter
MPDVSSVPMQTKDPICGMTVDPGSARFSGTYDGQKVYFCAARCQQQYEAARARRSP